MSWCFHTSRSSFTRSLALAVRKESAWVLLSFQGMLWYLGTADVPRAEQQCCTKGEYLLSLAQSSSKRCLSFVRKHLTEPASFSEHTDASVQKVLVGPNKNAFTFSDLVFRRGCGRATSNPRFYIQPDHRLAKWGSGFLVLHHFLSFLFLRVWLGGGSLEQFLGQSPRHSYFSHLASGLGLICCC